MTPRSWNRLCWVAAGALVLLFVVEGLWFIAANSQTADEAAHLVVGYSYWLHGDQRLNPDYPPLMRALAALPVYLWYRPTLDPVPDSRKDDIWRIGRDFLYSAAAPGDRLLGLARLPNLVLGTILVGLVGWWAYRLWGRKAGLLALALAALEPNLVAHSSVVTTDIGETLFLFLTLYLLWEYTARPSGWLLAALGLSMGLALATKHLTILLPGMVALLLAGQAIFGRTAPWPWLGPRANREPFRWRLAAAALTLSTTLTAAAAVVDLSYGARGLDGWWDGFQAVLKANEKGHPAFFLGQYSRGGWWDYFLVAFAIKTPLGSLVLIAAALLCVRADEPLGLRSAAFLLVPAAVWLVVVSRARINIGLRHILPVYPFLFVAAGRLATVRLPCWPGLVPLLVGLALLGTAVSSLRVAPHQLAYFNELVGGPGEGYRYLSDSNLDWGQDLKGLRDYLDREEVPMIYLAHFETAPPTAYGIRYQHLPAFGALGPPPLDVLPLGAGRELLVVSVTTLQGVYLADRTRYRWLDERKPVATIGYSLFVYDVTTDADAHFRLLLIYLKESRPDLAARELRRVLRLAPDDARTRRFLFLLREEGALHGTPSRGAREASGG